MSSQNENLDENIFELLDLYVLGALEETEEKQVRELIAKSEAAQKYVDESFSTLANFEDNAEYSPELLSRTKAGISENESQKDSGADSSNVKNVDFSKRNFIVPFLTGAIAASFIGIMIATFNGQFETESGKTAASVDQQMADFQSVSNTSNVSLTGENGKMGAKIMMHQQGDIMIDARTLSELDSNETYQLWAVVETATGQQVISAGVLGNKPGVYMAQVSGKVKAFAITKEVYGGVEKSNHEAMYKASVA